MPSHCSHNTDLKPFQAISHSAQPVHFRLGQSRVCCLLLTTIQFHPVCLYSLAQYSSSAFSFALFSWKTYHLLAPGQPIVPSWSGRGQNARCFPSSLSRKHCTLQITKPSSGHRPPHHTPREPGEGTANSRDLLQLYFITPVPD